MFGSCLQLCYTVFFLKQTISIKWSVFHSEHWIFCWLSLKWRWQQRPLGSFELVSGFSENIMSLWSPYNLWKPECACALVWLKRAESRGRASVWQDYRAKDVVCVCLCVCVWINEFRQMPVAEIPLMTSRIIFTKIQTSAVGKHTCERFGKETIEREWAHQTACWVKHRHRHTHRPNCSNAGSHSEPWAVQQINSNTKKEKYHDNTSISLERWMKYF